jgi:hypothetical protein
LDYRSVDGEVNIDCQGSETNTSDFASVISWKHVTDAEGGIYQISSGSVHNERDKRISDGNDRSIDGTSDLCVDDELVVVIKASGISAELSRQGSNVNGDVGASSLRDIDNCLSGKEASLRRKAIVGSSWKTNEEEISIIVGDGGTNCSGSAVHQDTGSSFAGQSVKNLSNDSSGKWCQLESEGSVLTRDHGDDSGGTVEGGGRSRASVHIWYNSEEEKSSVRRFRKTEVISSACRSAIQSGPNQKSTRIGGDASTRRTELSLERDDDSGVLARDHSLEENTLGVGNEASQGGSTRVIISRETSPSVRTISSNNLRTWGSSLGITSNGSGVRGIKRRIRKRSICVNVDDKDLQSNSCMTSRQINILKNKFSIQLKLN